MDLWTWMLFAHFLGDFPLQGAYLAENKSKDIWLMFAHAMIWAGCVAAVLPMSEFALLRFMFLVIGHSTIDFWKCQYVPNRRALYLDQAGHIIQLAVVYVTI